MKFSVLLLLMLIIYTTIFSQKQPKFVLQLDSLNIQNKIPVPFSTIVVLDARLDQSNVGTVVSNLSFKGMTKEKMLAVFPDSTHRYLPKVLKQVFNLSTFANDTLIILLKQFRIADHLANTVENYHKPESILTISSSFYKKEKGQIRKLFSINSKLAVAWLEPEPAKEQLANIRVKAISQLIYDAVKNQAWTPTQTVFSLNEMEAGLQKRMQLPFFSNQTLNNGVYKTFEEFKNNSPSVSEYKIGKLADDIKEVKDMNDNTIPQSNIWGLCDGKDRYVNFLGNYYKLSQEENCFSFMFERRESERLVETGRNVRLSLGSTSTYNIAPADLINGFRKNRRMERLYLNLETGEVHVEEIIGTASLYKPKN